MHTWESPVNCGMAACRGTLNAFLTTSSTQWLFTETTTSSARPVRMERSTPSSSAFFSSFLLLFVYAASDHVGAMLTEAMSIAVPPTKPVFLESYSSGYKSVYNCG